MTVIHKTPKDWRISPNLKDYEQTRAAFRWSTAPNSCMGMGSGLCNIAYAPRSTPKRNRSSPR